MTAESGSSTVLSGVDTTRQAGNLGAGLLNRFRVLFDYGNTKLWLEPGPAPGFAAPLPRDRTGLQFEVAAAPGGAGPSSSGINELVVIFVAPGSPAKEAGWVEGERVKALDGEPVGPDWWRVVTRWSRAEDGTVARVRPPRRRPRAHTETARLLLRNPVIRNANDFARL